MFEYVASGTSYFKLMYQESLNLRTWIGLVAPLAASMISTIIRLVYYTTLILRRDLVNGAALITAIWYITFMLTQVACR
jgi:hypothetical protein